MDSDSDSDSDAGKKKLPNMGLVRKGWETLQGLLKEEKKKKPAKKKYDSDSDSSTDFDFDTDSDSEDEKPKKMPKKKPVKKDYRSDSDSDSSSDFDSDADYEEAIEAKGKPRRRRRSKLGKWQRIYQADDEKLLLACATKRIDQAIELIKGDVCDINKQGENGVTALEYLFNTLDKDDELTVQEDDPRMVAIELLLSKPQLNLMAKDHDGDYFIGSLSVMFPKLKKKILGMMDLPEMNPDERLKFLVEYGFSDLACELLDNPDLTFNLKYEDEGTETIVDEATSYGFTDVMARILKYDGAKRWFISNQTPNSRHKFVTDIDRINWNIIDTNGNNILQRLCMSKCEPDSCLIPILAQEPGIDIGHVNNKGMTALMICSKSGNVENGLALVRSGRSNPTHMGNDGMTAIDYCLRKRTMRPVLMEIARQGDYSTDTVYASGMNLLMTVIKKNYVEIAQQLLDDGRFDLSKTDSNGWTVLMHLCNRTGRMLRLAVDIATADTGFADTVAEDYDDPTKRTAFDIAVSNKRWKLAWELFNHNHGNYAKLAQQFPKHVARPSVQKELVMVIDI